VNKKFYNISDVALLNSNSKTREEFLELYNNKYFDDESKWNDYIHLPVVEGITDIIDSRLKNRMSLMSIGVYYVMEKGPGLPNSKKEEICLFTGFGEIETTNKIIKSILVDQYAHVSPTLFHNSVHHTALGYYSIIKSIHNPCVTISDGLSTGLSFIKYIEKKIGLNEEFTIVAGEEYSDFFKLDKTVDLNIVSSFIAFRVKPDENKGFCYHGCVDTFDDLLKNDLYIKSKNIIANKDLFIKLKLKSDKRILTEYPINKDNPCGIIFRLAFPYYFNIKGSVLVLDMIEEKIHLFEVLT